MGRLLRVILDEDGPLIACAACRMHLSTPDMILSRLFQGQTGRAFLYRTVYNVRKGDAVTRAMTTGLHIVKDLYCIGCEQVLGWFYVKAYEGDQRYKEGKYILERLRTLEVRPGTLHAAEPPAGGGSPYDDSSHGSIE